MSPSESELRAALRHGEGDSVDPDRVISQAQQARRHRRVRFASVAGTVVAVAAVAVTVPLVVRRTGTPEASSGSATGAVSRAESSGGAAQESGTTGPVPSSKVAKPAPPPATGLPACPSSAPPVVLPRNRPGTVAGEGPLLPTSVTALRICEFMDGTKVDYSLAGAKAQAIADSLNALPTGSTSTPCPADDGPTVVLIALDTNGNPREAVANAGGCGVIVSGSAYRTTARDALRGLLPSIPGPIQLPTDKPSGRMSPGPGPS